ncbi:hypothetical protein JXA27_06465 [Aerococcaceae bacterium zg-B36]|uniref:hypothetical protein n=1 Tax=Aerococcaceae bacterium zg-252 TaxID=2796928 RepID=UPI001BD7FDF4|nr:hypothetical protein [Aerococcaceae bacterium zg-B36]
MTKKTMKEKSSLLNSNRVEISMPSQDFHTSVDPKPKKQKRKTLGVSESTHEKVVGLYTVLGHDVIEDTLNMALSMLEDTLSDEEKATLKVVTNVYKKNRK